MNDTVDAAMRHVRATADRFLQPWPRTKWLQSVDGRTERDAWLERSFEGIVLHPGSTTDLSCTLDIPAELHGVPLGGSLELTLDTLYPSSLLVDETPAFHEPGASVLAAPSPALVRRLETRSGQAKLHLTIRCPDVDLMPWWVRLTISAPELRERFWRLDLLWGLLAIADHVLVAPALRTKLLNTSSIVNDNPELPEPIVDGCINALSAALEDEDLPEVHIIGHCHIDLSWLWTWADAQETILRDLSAMCDVLDDYPEATVTHSQAAAYEVARLRDPSMFQRIRRHVRSGRWEAATTTWVEADTNIPSLESLCLQAVEGVEWTRQHLGVQPGIYLAPDNFGHSGNLPQLAVAAGAHTYYHTRANPGGEEYLPAYWWEGLDGSRLLALSTDTYHADLTPGAIAQACLRALRHGLPAGLLVHGVGNHGGGPTRRGLDGLRSLLPVRGFPRGRCTTLGDHAAALRASAATLPVHRGGSSTIFEGCYSSQAIGKSANRSSEVAILEAEAAGAVASSVPDLSDPIRLMLLDQFHDVIAGSSIAEVHREHAARAAVVVTAAKAVRDHAVLQVVQPAPDHSFAVLNLNPMPFDGLVQIPYRIDHPLSVVRDGRSLDSQPTSAGALVPLVLEPLECIALSATERSRQPQPSTPAVEVEPAFSRFGPQRAVLDVPAVTEPPFIRVATGAADLFVRRDSGVVVSMRLAGGRELVPFGLRRPTDYVDAARPELAMNVLQLLEERPHGMSAWQLSEVWRETSLIDRASCEILESGPLRAMVQITHRLSFATLRQRLTWLRGSPLTDVEIRINWREPGGPVTGVRTLKVAATVNASSVTAWGSVPGGAVSRPVDGLEWPGQRWGWVGSGEGGIAILNQDRVGYDALGSRLRLTLHRTPYSPDANADVGNIATNYGLLPTPGDWRSADIPAQAEAFMRSPLVLGGVRPVDSQLSMGIPQGSGVVCTSIRAANGGGYVIRLCESLGTSAVVTLPQGRDIRRCSLGGVPLEGGNLSGGTWQMRPWEVATLLVS